MNPNDNKKNEDLIKQNQDEAQNAQKNKTQPTPEEELKDDNKEEEEEKNKETWKDKLHQASSKGLGDAAGAFKGNSFVETHLKELEEFNDALKNEPKPEGKDASEKSEDLKENKKDDKNLEQESQAKESPQLKNMSDSKSTVKDSSQAAALNKEVDNMAKTVKEGANKLAETVKSTISNIFK